MFEFFAPQYLQSLLKLLTKCLFVPSMEMWCHRFQLDLRSNCQDIAEIRLSAAVEFCCE